MGLAEEIQKLQELKQNGVLTDDEFAKAKASLLNTSVLLTATSTLGPSPAPLPISPASSQGVQSSVAVTNPPRTDSPQAGRGAAARPSGWGTVIAFTLIGAGGGLVLSRSLMPSPMPFLSYLVVLVQFWQKEGWRQDEYSQVYFTAIVSTLVCAGVGYVIGRTITARRG